MATPDLTSLHALEPLSHLQAAVALADPELRSQASLLDTDLPALIAKLQLTIPERIACGQDLASTANILKLLKALTNHRISFVVIGGLAGRLYGSNYSTADLDVCHARDRQNLARLAALLRELCAEFRRMPVCAPARLHEETFETEDDFIFNTPSGNLDLIGRFTGVGAFAQAEEDAIPVSIGGERVWTLSLPKLMAAKDSTGRPKDQLVFRELLLVKSIYEKIGRSALTASCAAG